MTECEINVSEPPCTRPENPVPSSMETDNPNGLPTPGHCSVCIKHWFFRHYNLVAAVLLASGLYASRSVHTEDQWKVLGGIVGGVLSLTYFIQKQKLEELKLFKEIFTTFNATYDSLDEKLNRIRDAGPNSQLEAADRQILFRYFNLCGEEYLYYRLGYIFPEVWRAWCNGMQIFHKVPRIRQLWDDEIKTGSYYGLQLQASPRGWCLCRRLLPSERGIRSPRRRRARTWLLVPLVTAVLQFSAVEPADGATVTIDWNTFNCEAEREKALKGDALAQFITASCCGTNYAEAVAWYRKAAEQGHREAQFRLAECYAQGSGVAKDTTEAVKWYRKAADGGPADVQFWVATRFWSEASQPHAIPPDPQECLKWLKKSAEQGNRYAQEMLGRIYQKGELLPKDESEGSKWLRKAADHEYPGVSKWRKAAERGNHEAQFQLGELYANGENEILGGKVQKDAAEAIKCYRKAAEGGSAEVQFWVAARFWSPTDSTNFTLPGTPPEPRHFGIPADPQECLKWLRKSAERGHVPAQTMLGEIYEDGELLPRDEAEGLNWLRKAAGQGDSSAQRDLGERYLSGTPEGVKWLRRYCESACESAVVDPRFGALVGMHCSVLAGYYESGRAVPKDQAEAIRWYRKAAELGDSVGQQRLARISQSGQGTAKDPFAAFNWYQLGTAYEEGRGAPKDPAEAARCYRKAADEGPGGGDPYQVLSQIALGKLYAEGRGVRLDGFEAIKWYQKAADGGSVDALVCIAEVWAFGKGIPKNVSEAVKWYNQAAQKGNAVSKFNLGVFYFKGEGVPVDYVEAYKWYNLAAAGGYGKATELRNSLALLMTREQIAVAQQRASDFLVKKHPDSGRTIGGNPSALDPSGPDPKASGSGFFITEDGYLLTNAHVVDEATRLAVRTSLGTFSASLVKADSVNDIAVLKVAGRFHPLPIIPSRTVKLGDAVFTIGFPNPQLQGIDPKLTDGKISSLAGAQDDARQFQISAAVQPGNSGGALVNSGGNVIGIVAARLSDLAAFKTSGALPQNVNYAVKSSYVLSLLESLPEVANKLKEPGSVKERQFQDVVREVEDAAALVLVY